MKKTPRAREAHRVARTPVDEFYSKGKPSPAVRLGAGNVISVEKNTVTCVMHNSIIPDVSYVTDQDPGPGDLAEIWSLDDVLFTPGFTKVDDIPPNRVQTNEPSPFTTDVNISGSFNDTSWFFQDVDKPSWQSEVTEQLVGLRITREGNDSVGVLWSDEPINVRPGDTINFAVTASYLSGAVASMEFVVCWGVEKSDALPSPNTYVNIYPPQIDVDNKNVQLSLNVTVPNDDDLGFVPLRARIGLRFANYTTGSGGGTVTYGEWQTLPEINYDVGYSNSPTTGFVYGLEQRDQYVGYRSAEGGFTDWGTVDGTNLSDDNLMRDQAGQSVYTSLAGKAAVAGSSQWGVWQSDVEGSPGWPADFNAPYRYKFAAASGYYNYWIEPKPPLPYPPIGQWPEGATRVDFESQQWGLVRAILKYKIAGQVHTEFNSELSSSVSFRLSANPVFLEPHYTADLPVAPEQMDLTVWSGFVSSFGLRRNGEDAIAEQFYPYEGTRDITTTIVAAGSTSNGVVFSFSADGGGTFRANTVDQVSDGQRMGGWVYAGMADEIYIAYVLQPPRYRYVFSSGGSGGSGSPLRDVELLLHHAAATRTTVQDHPIGEIKVDPGGDTGGNPTCDVSEPSEKCLLTAHPVPADPQTGDWHRSPAFPRVTVTAPRGTGGIISVTGQSTFTGRNSHAEAALIELRLASSADDGQWPKVVLAGTQHFTLLGNVHLDAGEQAQVWAEYRFIDAPIGETSLDQAFLSSTFLPGGHRSGETSRPSLQYWDGDRYQPPAQEGALFSYEDAEIDPPAKQETYVSFYVTPMEVTERDIVSLLVGMPRDVTGTVTFYHSTSPEGPWTSFGSSTLDSVSEARRTWLPTKFGLVYLRARYNGSSVSLPSEKITDQPVIVNPARRLRTTTFSSGWTQAYDGAGNQTSYEEIQQGQLDPEVGNRMTLLNLPVTLPDDADVMTAVLACAGWTETLNPSGMALCLGWHSESSIPATYLPDDRVGLSEHHIIEGPFELGLTWLVDVLNDDALDLQGITIGPGTSDGSEYVGSTDDPDPWTLTLTYYTSTVTP